MPSCKLPKLPSESTGAPKRPWMNFAGVSYGASSERRFEFRGCLRGWQHRCTENDALQGRCHEDVIFPTSPKAQTSNLLDSKLQAETFSSTRGLSENRQLRCLKKSAACAALRLKFLDICRWTWLREATHGTVLTRSCFCTRQ
eukprot:symbB.v1.2.024056.t2/scaffold2246.1/size98716/5